MCHTEVEEKKNKEKDKRTCVEMHSSMLNKKKMLSKCALCLQQG